jgi:hypothetical protein
MVYLSIDQMDIPTINSGHADSGDVLNLAWGRNRYMGTNEDNAEYAPFLSVEAV